MMQRRPASGNSKRSLIISLIIHAVLGGVILMFAAHEGILGKRSLKIAVTLLPVKPAMPTPIQKTPVAPSPKPQPDFTALSHPTASDKSPAQTLLKKNNSPAIEVAATPKVSLPPAPPPAAIPEIDFGNGRTASITSDPNLLYKGYLEYTFRSNWIRPAHLADAHWAAEMTVAVDRFGRITGGRLTRSSKNVRWDDSVKLAVAKTTFIDRPPPAGFPQEITIRFDVPSTFAEAKQ